jgi:hypothetical protein
LQHEPFLVPRVGKSNDVFVIANMTDGPGQSGADSTVGFVVAYKVMSTWTVAAALLPTGRRRPRRLHSKGLAKRFDAIVYTL